MRAPEFWSAEGAAHSIWPAVLAPFALGFRLAGRIRRTLGRPFDPGVPVICVGNLAAGGAGKTPAVIALVRRLAARGQRVFILSRGYGGRAQGPLLAEAVHHTAAEVGDEPILLAAVAPTVVARDLAKGTMMATSQGARVIVMDDGFQNPWVRKTLSILVFDGDFGLGNGRVIPAGPLRETLAEGLARADGVIVVGTDSHGLIPRVTPRPLLRATLVPAGGADLADTRVLAFAGIGRPQKFFSTLETLGARLVAHRTFGDHHPYTEREIEDLLSAARELDAVAVTTEKDAVRIPPAYRREIRVLPVALVFEDEGRLDSLLDAALA